MLITLAVVIVAQIGWLNGVSVPQPSVKVKLVGGPNRYEGYAMMYRNGKWGSICDKVIFTTGWPTVICRELGHGNALKFERNKAGVKKPDGDIAFQCPACSPKNAKNMASCGKDKATCGHGDDIYVTCRPNYKYKLEGGKSEHEGYAMLCNPDNPSDCGTICDIGFVKTGWPKVFCLGLGYDDVIEAKYATAYGVPAKTGKIAFQSPACGPPAIMATCGVDKNPACNHAKDVYVKCKGTPKNPSGGGSTGGSSGSTGGSSGSTGGSSGSTGGSTGGSSSTAKCVAAGGKCMDGPRCADGYQSAKSLGKTDLKCDGQKCCFAKPKSVCPGKCFSEKCGEGYKSSKGAGKCDKDASGNRLKCCVLKPQKEDSCTPGGGKCTEDRRCPDGFTSGKNLTPKKDGQCSKSGYKCCYTKPPK